MFAYFRSTAVIIACATSATPALAIPSFTPLGDLPGGAFDSRAHNISADGKTVVGFSSSSSGTEAFAWTAEDGIYGLGDLPGGLFESFAWNVSADGRRVVGTGRSVTGQQAFVFDTQSRTFQTFNTIPGVVNEGLGITDDGTQIVGQATGNGSTQAFRYNINTDQATMLGTIPNAPTVYSSAWSISADGNKVAGLVRVSGGSNGDRAAVYDFDDQSWSLLGSVGGSQTSFLARSISSDGTAIVGTTAIEGFYYDTETETIHGLGISPGGLNFSNARDVSADGSIVVGLDGADAAVFNPATNGIQSVRSILEDLGLSSEITGWELQEATGISADGLTIAGWGRNPQGNREAWIVTIPEPGYLPVFLCGAFYVLSRPNRCTGKG